MANEGLRSYIERTRAAGKPLYFTNIPSGQNPDSWPKEPGAIYSRPEETWNQETQAELNKPASGFDYSEDVGQRFPLLREEKQGQTGTAGGQQSKGFILNKALAELQNHIPGIVKHTLGGKSKPENSQEKKAVQQNIKSYLGMIMKDMEKTQSTKTQKQKEFEYYKGLPGEDKALYAKTFGKSGGKAGSGESFAQKEQYKYLVGRLEELDKKLHGEWSEDLTDEERAKIQNERKTILDGMVELENTMGAGGNAGGMGRSPGGGQTIDKRSAIKMAKDAGASKEDITNFLKQNPNVSVDNFLTHFKASNAEASTGQQTAQEAPDVKNTPINSTRQQAAAPDSTAKTASSGGLQRNNVPYNTSMTGAPTDEQQAAAKQELTDLAHKLGVGPENWKALGQLAKDLGGWAWETYTNALNTLNQGQQETRKQLPAYNRG